MNRDSKGRFKSKGLFIPIPTASFLANLVFLLFFLLPWLFVFVKFKIFEKFYEYLSFLFLDERKCTCTNEDTPKY